MDNLIKKIEKIQEEYLVNKEKNILKKKSQFFTPYDIAYRMVNTINFDEFRKIDKLYILEPAAGCGILIAVLIKEILCKVDNIREIYVDAYENDEEIINLLRNNLRNLKVKVEESNVSFKYKVIGNNFIVSNKNKWNNNKKDISKYDIIISNPPYKKINQKSHEAKIMNDIVHGQPNLYTLFIAMSLKLLKSNGTYIVLSPRNYLTGEYSKKIRNYIFELSSLTHINSFENRNIFLTVNQEVIISTYKKKKDIKYIDISYNNNKEFVVEFDNIVIDRKSMSIIVPKNKEDIVMLNSFNKFGYSLNDLGFKVNVGPIVQFRHKNFLSRDIYNDDYAPMVIGNDIQGNNKIIYYTRENKRKTHHKSISIESKKLIDNGNYLLLRKVSAKDDKSIITCAILENTYFKHSLIGLDNNLLYFLRADNSFLSIEECFGLYCIINSNQFSNIYSIINGTHTINVTDFSKIKFPSYEKIISMGRELINIKQYNKEICSNLFNKYI